MHAVFPCTSRYMHTLVFMVVTATTMYLKIFITSQGVQKFLWLPVHSQGSCIIDIQRLTPDSQPPVKYRNPKSIQILQRAEHRRQKRSLQSRALSRVSWGAAERRITNNECVRGSEDATCKSLLASEQSRPKVVVL